MVSVGVRLMITKIARKEFVEMWRDGRFRWSALIVMSLLVAALALGWKNYTTARREREAAQAESRATWEGQGARNPHSAAHFGVYAFKPKTPLSLVDTGLDSFTGTNVWVEAHYQNPSRGRPVEDATALQRFGELTAAGVLLLLLPLVIVFLSFDAFAGERERGTLRQVLSLGVGRGPLVAGKASGLLAALLTLLVPATCVGVLALALATTDELLLWSLPRFALMCAGYLLYFGAFVGVALTVSALATSARVALVVLLSFWVLNCLVAPRVANDVAERIHPTPTASAFWAGVDKDLKEGIDGHDPSNDRRKELERRVLAQYGVERVEDLPVNFNGIALNAGEEYGNRVFDKHWGRLWRTYYAQETVQQAFGVVAPFLPARSVSMGLAGTDLAQHEHFSAAVESYRRDFNRMLNTHFAEHSRTSDGYNYFVGREVWERSPEFDYVQPAIGWVLSRQTGNFVLLAAWCFGSLGLAVFAAARLKAY
jgi:ABC-2 type transport system permease protein